MNRRRDWNCCVLALSVRVTLVGALVTFLLLGCTSVRVEDEETSLEAMEPPTLIKPISPVLSPWVLQSALGGPGSADGISGLAVGAEWKHHLLPGKRPTQYTYDATQPVPNVRADAHASASLIRRSLNIPADQLGVLAFSWRQDALIPGADLAYKDKADAALRIILAFDGDSSRLSGRHGMVSELIRMVTGEPLPYATLMYVWCNACPSESVLVNPRTDRIKKIAVQSGPDRLGQWLSYQRDVRADFIRAFGEPPGRLQAIGLMTDTDNTQERTQVWYGPIRWAEPSRR
jgi:hypothetical protein